eukprot:718194-Prorocentrum_minimum.AAC.1
MCLLRTTRCACIAHTTANALSSFMLVRWIGSNRRLRGAAAALARTGRLAAARALHRTRPAGVRPGRAAYRGAPAGAPGGAGVARRALRGAPGGARAGWRRRGRPLGGPGVVPRHAGG